MRRSIAVLQPGSKALFARGVHAVDLRAAGAGAPDARPPTGADYGPETPVVRSVLGRAAAPRTLYRMDAVMTGVKCSVCGTPYSPEAASSARSGDRPGCAKCGSENITYEVLVEVPIASHCDLRFKAKHETGGTFVEVRSGDSLHRDTQTWSNRYQLIDHDNDRYVKHITNSAGEVVRDVDGRLSKHLGHGADHSRPKSHP